MTVLTIRDLTIRLGGRALLEGTALQVDVGRKIGLIGRNGAGKSTLLRAIVGELQPDGGEIRLSARARMGHVAQEAPAEIPFSLTSVVMAAMVSLALLPEVMSTTVAAAAEVLTQTIISTAVFAWAPILITVTEPIRTLK